MKNELNIQKIIQGINNTKGNRKYCYNLPGHLSDYAESIVHWLKATTPERIDALVSEVEKLRAERDQLAAENVDLSAMGSEPVAWDYEWASCITCEGPQNFKRVIKREAPPEWAIDEGQARNIIPLYRHAQPAPELKPVAWTDEEELRDANIAGIGYLFGIDREANKFADPRRQIMLYCRAAMPNGSKS